MEPLGRTAAVRDDGVDVWVATQSPSRVGATAAELIPEPKVRVHSKYLGGGFGRRSQADLVAEAIELAKRVGAPVKVTWSRADDVQGGRYRPRRAGALLRRGRRRRNALRLDAPDRRRPDQLGHRGRPGRRVRRCRPAYAVSNLEVTYARPTLPITTWYWRSAGHSQNGWVVESFLDELFALGGKDPVEGRLALLRDHPRHRKVVEVAADRAGWGRALPEGRARKRVLRGVEQSNP